MHEGNTEGRIKKGTFDLLTARSIKAAAATAPNHTQTATAGRRWEGVATVWRAVDSLRMPPIGPNYFLRTRVASGSYSYLSVGGDNTCLYLVEWHPFPAQTDEHRPAPPLPITTHRLTR